MEQLVVAVAVVVCAAVVLVAFGGGSLGGKKKEPLVAAPPEEESLEESRAPRPKVTVCFGSQTGTAEQFSKTLRDEGRKEGYAMRIVDLEDFVASDAAAETLIFLMATYGEGEPTDNAHGFVRWAKQSVKDKPLSQGRFAVFGLGNTQYEHYNAMGKQTDDLLEKLGGTRFYDLGLGDDDKDLDADFEQWRSGLWKALKAELGGGESADDAAADDDDDDSAAEETFQTVAVEGSEEFAKWMTTASSPSEASSSTKYYFTAARLRVGESRELRSPEDGGSTRHLELDCEAAFYETADNVAILAENDPDDVNAVLAALRLPKQKRFVFAGDKNTKKQFPTPCSFGVAIARYCDLSAKPKKPALKTFAALIGSPELAALVDEDRLDDDDALSSLANVARRFAAAAAASATTTTTTTKTKNGAVVPLTYDDDDADVASRFGLFLEKVATHLQPRYYTIASSSVADTSKVHVVCSVVDLPDGRRGLCSGYLAGLRKGDLCAAFVRPSSFRMPPPREEGGGGETQKKAPLVLVGPGTGLAPMRAVLRERASGVGPFATQVSEACLYFGCKKPELDFIYEDELRAWEKRGDVLDKLEIAFSRAQKEKVYVQDLMKRPADRAYLKRTLLDERGVLFVCGGTNMGRAVLEALLDVFMDALPRDAAAAAVDAMRNEGRYVQELWA